MLDVIREHIWWVTGISALLMVVGLVVVSIFLVRMPADYFVRPKPAPSHSPSQQAGFHVLRRIGKNALGVLLLAAGVLMSLPLVPGPGLLLILVGVSLTDFPGKRRFELWIIRRRLVLKPANWLRGKYGRPPLELPPAKSKGREGTAGPTGGACITSGN
jgi:hypothetical protein